MRFALAGLVLLVAGGCGRPVQIDYYNFDFPKPLTHRELISHSTAIVVGTVTSVKVTRKAVPARKQPKLLLDQTRVEIAVENALLGEVPQQLTFEFFAYSPQNGGYSGPPLFRVRSGERRIFFLTRDSGEFRSTGDVRDYTLKVWSGRHKKLSPVKDMADAMLDPASTEAIGNAISEVLLGLGDTYNPQAMTAELKILEETSDELAGPARTAARLALLVANESDLRLAATACLELSERYAGQSGCLSRFEKNELVPEDLRRKATEMHTTRQVWDERLKRRLRAFPLIAFDGDSIFQLRQELRLLLDSPDPELKQLACETLLRSFAETQPRCPPKK